MVGDGDLTQPVSYSSVWLVVAVVLPLVVVAWYAGAAWLTRDTAVSHQPAWLRLRTTRRAHLRELERIAAARAGGELSTRQAHQAVGAAVRSFLADVGPVDVRAMNLEQLRHSGVPHVARVVELVYPPSFRPREQAEDQGRLDTALADARELVSGWRG